MQLLRRCIAVALLTLAAVGLTLATVFLAAPRAAARALATLTPEVMYFVPGVTGAVALTIDDGPHPLETPAILDVLRAYGARATFFLIGARIQGHEALIRRMRREGHELGNHDYDDRRSAFVPSPELSADLRATHERLAPFGPVRWFRPGAGLYSPALLRLAAEHGYELVLGDVAPLDAALPWTGFHRWYILRHAHPGSIIVLHDGGGRGGRSAETLARILPVLRERGLDVITVSELERRAAPPGG